MCIKEGERERKKKAYENLRNNHRLAKRLEKEVKEAGDDDDKAELQQKRRNGVREGIVAIPDAP